MAVADNDLRTTATATRERESEEPLSVRGSQPVGLETPSAIQKVGLWMVRGEKAVVTVSSAV